MASFVADLWESIFTPGPTPVLLQAANASFAALQVLLLILLYATYSIHFIILSVLCGGLWWAINWFAAELAAAKERGELDDKEKKDSAGPVDESDDTEVDEPKQVSKNRGSSDVQAVDQKGQVTQRRGKNAPSGEQSSVSTEDEWEKVSENEQ